MYLQTLMTVHVRWPGQTSGAFGLALIFLVLFASRQKEHRNYSNKFYVLSFACAKERTKEKHTGNDIQPLPAPWLGFSTTVNCAKQFLSSAYPDLKDEKSCFVIHCKPERRCPDGLQYFDWKDFLQAIGKALDHPKILVPQTDHWRLC